MGETCGETIERLKAAARPAVPWLPAIAAAFVLYLSSPASAQTFSPEYRTLGIGQAAAEINTFGFENFACGSNGGPPGPPLAGWTDFMQCPPEPSGLREVYVEYNTTSSPLSQAFRERNPEELWLQRYGITRMGNFPVALSLLFDETGTARLFRVVTDSRASDEDKERSHLLAQRVMPNYGLDGWRCADRPAGPGQSAVGDVFYDQVCTKMVDGKYVRIEAHQYRVEGQPLVDAMTRWEVYDASLPPSALPQ
ncbi:MAG: hypothetical protein IT535_00250 [Bauldia sp.]|nr:hypothetical protein [Bauldia sp.]